MVRDYVDGPRFLDRLQNAAPPAEPVVVELRDGQIYRWQEQPED
jgi:hypothetical protein